MENKPKEPKKKHIYREFKGLEDSLHKTIGSTETKKEIIERVEDAALNNEKRELIFVKTYLARPLSDYFSKYHTKTFIGGVNKPIVSFRDTFIETAPSCDFAFLPKQVPAQLFESHKQFLPIGGIIGEVKYGPLNVQSFSTGLGQVIVGLHASESKYELKKYGCYIFFRTNSNSEISQDEKNFKRYIWSREDIFIIII